MDVTIVIKNRNVHSIFYYSGYVVSIVDDQGGDREDETDTDKEDDNTLVGVEEDEETDDQDSDLGVFGRPLILRASTCTPESPCGQCEGDCNKNAHCGEGLECFYRPDKTPIPGCIGEGVAGKTSVL